MLSALPVVAANQSNSLDAPAVDTGAAAQTTAVVSEEEIGDIGTETVEMPSERDGAR